MGTLESCLAVFGASGIYCCDVSSILILVVDWACIFLFAPAVITLYRLLSFRLPGIGLTPETQVVFLAAEVDDSVA